MGKESMIRRWMILFGVLSAAGGCVSTPPPGCEATEPPHSGAAVETTYHGRPLDRWAAELRARDERRRTVRALGFRGPAAVPALSAALDDADWGVRAEAAYALGYMGTAAWSAVPRLERLLEDEDVHVRKAAAFALQRILPPAERPKPRRRAVEL
jgi:hypothetical protein